jgi:hypothetical protein
LVKVETLQSRRLGRCFFAHIVAHDIGEIYRKETYVWFSPLGARIHAAAQKITTTTSPMKGAQLGRSACSLLD